MLPVTAGTAKRKWIWGGVGTGVALLVIATSGFVALRCATVDEKPAQPHPLAIKKAAEHSAEQAARAQASLHLDQQPREVRRKYFEGRASTALAHVETLDQALQKLEQSKQEVEPAKQTMLDERIRSLRERLSRAELDSARFSSALEHLGDTPNP
jgi:hypothetical protein